MFGARHGLFGNKFGTELLLVSHIKMSKINYVLKQVKYIS